MSDKVANKLGLSLSVHSWNNDHTKVAVSPNSNVVQIYKKQGTEFVLEATLKEHDSVVTGIDWGKTRNRILTCSQDRNAYVWDFEGNEWKPTLVLLRINRAATTCAWSPKEDKFAIGSGDKTICICFYEKDNQWWVSKHIGSKAKIESTITTLAWHPNNILLAAGGTDSKVRVVSTFIKNIDDRASVAKGTPFGDKLPFGILLAEWKLSAWVTSIAWSPSANQLAWSTRDSTLHILQCANTNHTLQSLRYPHLPICSVVFGSEGSIVGVGYDCNPLLFKGAGGNWQFVGFADKGKANGGQNLSAKNIWESRANTGTEDKSQGVTLNTVHQNTIKEVLHCGTTHLSTVGIDGQLVLWSNTALGV